MSTERATRRVVLVTGGGCGIGEAVARAFARTDCDVVLVARTRAEIERVAREIEASGARALALPGDLRHRAIVERIVEMTLETFGRLDVLVNAAGIYGPIGTLVETDPVAWAETIEINLIGTMHAIRAVLPHMLEQRNGVILNFSGGGAVAPLPRFSAYGASKAAIVRLTETLAEEVRDAGIRVNAIAPGAVNTRMLDQVLAAGERAGREFHAKALEQRDSGGTSPERAAELAVFLASVEARGISGRLISAVWDDWKSLPQRAVEIAASSLYTLRRIDGRNFTEVRQSP
jgi:NAD(P)-dependent dehydrogenase (short-subunit alcohol dehydrogenase family)